MVAYQAESELVRALAAQYRRARDEGRTLTQAAFVSAADLEVSTTELRVTPTAELAASHAGDRSPVRGTQRAQRAVPGLSVAAAVCHSHPVVSRKADIFSSAVSGDVDSGASGRHTELFSAASLEGRTRRRARH